MAEHVKPYNEQEEKRKQISRMFDNIAKRYDFLNHFLSLGIDRSWRKKAIAELKELQPKRVLDVATGTADVALEVYNQVKPEKIVGIDISPKMLEIGKQKIKDRELKSIIELMEGDSENLPFEDNSFDAITVAFGVRNYQNLERGMAEMYRVLAPGGKMVILELSRPTMFPFKQLYNFYFSSILPTIGRLTSKDNRAYSYLYESVQAFPEGKAFKALLEKIGLKSTKCNALTLGVCSLYVGTK